MKRINPSDVVVVPYQANKQVELTYSNLPNVCQEPVSTDVKILTGKNLSGTFNKETDPKTNGQYQRLVYDSINNLYYKNNSFSYPSLNKIFPTELNSTIRVIQIPYGKIKPNEFKISSNSFNIEDDGYGNIIDTNSNIQIGNIFYENGIVVISNQNYFCLFPIEPTVFPKKYKFYKNETKILRPLIDTITYCATSLNVSTLELIDSDTDFTNTITNGEITFTNNTVGTYKTKYRVKDSLGICSNIEEIEVEVLDNCDFDLTISNPTVVTENCVSSFVDYELVKVSNLDCEPLSNNIKVNVSKVEKSSVRINGINDYLLEFSFDKNYNISFSKDGGLSYYTISPSATRINIDTALTNPIIYFRNAFFFLLRVKETDNDTSVEYLFKCNPLTGEYSFEKVKEYIDVEHYAINGCKYNEYKVVTNNCKITSIDWSFTGEINGIPTGIDSIMLFGCRGDVVATIHSTCCVDSTKTLTFNGNCIEPSCDSSKIELEVYPTLVKNNYIIFANTNFNLKEYPNWQFNGGVKYISDRTSNFIEIKVDESVNINKLIYISKDFCKSLYSELVFDRIKEITFTTTIPTTTSTTTFIDDGIIRPNSSGGRRGSEDEGYSDLELSFYSNIIAPKPNETLDFTLIVQNKGNLDASNIYFKVKFDNTFIIDEDSLISYQYQTKSDGILISRGLLAVGDSYVVKFKGKFTGNLGDIRTISSQITSVDQIDPDSTPNNNDFTEDDAKLLTYTLSNITTTSSTTFDCKPIIREYPYTNYVCTISNDNRGMIVISAINPVTQDSTGLEYSFNGDKDINYTANHQSNYMSNGLYEVWVRLVANPSCKTSTKVRISCGTDNAEIEWTLSGNTCIR